MRETFSHQPDDVAAVQAMIDYLLSREQALYLQLRTLTPGVEPWGRVRDELQRCADRRCDLLALLGLPTDDADHAVKEYSRPVDAQPVETFDKPEPPVVAPPVEPVQLSLVLEI